MVPADPPGKATTALRVNSWLKRPRFWALGWLGWFVTLCILSSMSQPGPRIDVVGIDKVYHAVYFLTGGTLLYLALGLRDKPGQAVSSAGMAWKPALIVILTGAAVGWFDEWHQSFTPGRFGLDRYDWLADVVGSVAAVPVGSLLLRRLTRPLPEERGTP